MDRPTSETDRPAPTRAAPEGGVAGRAPDAVTLTDVVQDYPGAPGVIDVASLVVADHPARAEFDVLMGPSGCGKSTLLRYIAGLQNPTKGAVLIRGQEQRATRHGPLLPVAMVFQHPTVMPWLTAHQNVVLALRLAEVDEAERDRAADELLERVGIRERRDALATVPLLSGGQLRRLEIARALAGVRRPGSTRVLVLDEPFTGLDAASKLGVQTLLREVWREHELTVILTTHDPREAVYLGDRVHVLASSPGRVRAVVEVDALYGGPFPTDREPDLRSTATFARLVTDTEALVASPLPPRG